GAVQRRFGLANRRRQVRRAPRLDQPSSQRRSFAFGPGRSGGYERAQFQPTLCGGDWANTGPRPRAVAGGGGAASAFRVTYAGQAYRAALWLRLGGNHAPQLPSPAHRYAARLPFSIYVLKSTCVQLEMVAS